ncbi:struthiocalcin-1-like [Sphaerodactylus townsendi]|uniref:Uncharacterized protein n=1 Tax=Sphaerodactylus townsendi TaxID=933632 RepID=A0ACB8FLP9_9SAUR|nr:struthiocalcin-1-like [Sphaerodactylus townsendi]
MMLPACLSLGLLCLAIGPFLSGVDADQCPKYWMSYNGHCYGYFHQEMSWRQAQAHCQRQGANLASILDRSEHQAVADFLHRIQFDDEDVWFGLSTSNRNQGWVWADGSPTGYSSWDRFKPSSFLKNEHCALLEEDSGFMVWDNDSCYERNPFLCKL